MSSHIELLPFPEDCILLDTDFEEDNIDSIIDALKINLEEREIADSITIKEKILESEKFLVINKFLTQLIFCSMYQDKCNVSMKQWFKKDKTPQLILASQIDEENLRPYNSVILCPCGLCPAKSNLDPSRKYP